MKDSKASEDHAAALRVFNAHLDLVKRICSAALRRDNSLGSLEQVTQTGRVALWETAAKYHDLPFEQFEAIALVRIRGAIRDEARSSKVLNWSRSQQRERLSIVYIDDGELEGRGVKLLSALATNWEPEIEIDRRSMTVALRPLLQRLPKRERDIMRALLSGRSQRSVGIDEGLSQVRICQVVAEITAELRRKLLKRPFRK